MTDQLYITDDGQIDAQPLTWDGEPVYSPASVQEGLFEALAFEQMPGQTALKLVYCACCRQDFFSEGEPYCSRCMELGR